MSDGSAFQALPTERGYTTLSQHVRCQLGKDVPRAWRLSAALDRIALAGKAIARCLSRASLVEGGLGVTGENNVQGEAVKPMDTYANEAFIAVFRNSGLVSTIVSEEMAEPYELPENAAEGSYALAIDPIDGSSNLDVNLNVGTVFALYERPDGAIAQGLLQNGSHPLATGYVLYGASTMLVCSWGDGVRRFSLEPSLGEFILTAQGERIPERGSLYSINEGNFRHWEAPLRDFIRHAHQAEDYSARYSGSLATDFHRILSQGGVFLYPGTHEQPAGKLRWLYEAAPLAFLVEQAGGCASTGKARILDVVPEGLHARTPLVVGSPANVRQVESFVRAPAQASESAATTP